MAGGRSRARRINPGPRTQAIAAAQAQVQDASAKARNAAAQAARANALAKANMLSLSERDSAHSEQARAEAQRSAAEENLKLLQAGSRDEQLAQGRARLAAAASTLALQRQRLAELTLSAPSDGQVDELPYRVGERVARGALLATLLQGDQAYARLYIPQQQRASLAPGAALQLRISGYEQPLQGTVRSIAQAPAFTPTSPSIKRACTPGVSNRSQLAAGDKKSLPGFQCSGSGHDVDTNNTMSAQPSGSADPSLAILYPGP